jgi:hypothetical protein
VGELAGAGDEGGLRGRLEGWLGRRPTGERGGLRRRGGRAAGAPPRPRVAVAGGLASADGRGDGGVMASGGRSCDGWR